MPIVQATIEAQIERLLTETEGLSPDEAKVQFKKQLATIIVNAIASATITIAPGLIITVGSATTQTNTTPVVVQKGLS